MSLPGFKQLTSRVSIFDPPTTKSSPDHPDAILLFTWLGAGPKHIIKYIAGYQSLFPNTKIVLMRCEFFDMAGSIRVAESNGLTAISAAYSGTSPTTTSPSPRVLTHIWSNGGAFMFQAAATAYQKKYNAPFAPSVLFLDSTPGSNRFVGAYSKALNLMRAVLPKTLLMRVAGYFYAVLFILALFVFPRLKGYRRSLPTLLRRNLSDTAYVAKSVPRSYFYSDGDDLIEAEWVEKHGKEASEKGYDVRLVPFKGSPHVAHMRMHPEMYWGHVTARWNEATGVRA
ncbi:Hypothetical protein D9617_5g069770 [Elsinoe fawcettii]|nr:Hypothetical protein D9617_5g069770 [Elsinoe fawcettii]